ncbi:hypothetical protein LINPERPRIM_LOCUS12388 [Linum perenne]
MGKKRMRHLRTCSRVELTKARSHSWNEFVVNMIPSKSCDNPANLNEVALKNEVLGIIHMLGLGHSFIHNAERRSPIGMKPPVGLVEGSSSEFPYDWTSLGGVGLGEVMHFLNSEEVSIQGTLRRVPRVPTQGDLGKGGAPKIQGFCWMVWHKKIASMDNLPRRGLMFVNRCALCEKDLEIVDHLLIHYDFASAIWNMDVSMTRIILLRISDCEDGGRRVNLKVYLSDLQLPSKFEPNSRRSKLRLCDMFLICPVSL